MINVVFVVPFGFETSLRFLRATLALPGVRVGLVSQDPLERFGAEIKQRLAGHCQVADGLDARQLARASARLAEQIGPVGKLLGVLEQLQVPLAEARALLSLPGLSPDAAHGFRDKSVMKDRLRAAGLPCARHVLLTSMADAGRVEQETGFPVVIKPPSGAGAAGTYRLGDARQLREALAAFPPSASRPMMVEEFVQGEEHSFDAVFLEGQPLWHSISRYAPSPLTVLENDWIQWTVLLPREIDGPEYDPIRKVGYRAMAVLGLDTGLAHMEWFRRADGSVAISEVGARPPGAQFTTLLSHAHGTDLYAAWARLMVLEQFDPPPRRFAVGAAYLRGQGRGKVANVSGLEQAQQEMGSLVVDAQLPKAGQVSKTGYEGDGHVILRHEETEVVKRALERLVSLVRVELG